MGGANRKNYFSPRGSSSEVWTAHHTCRLHSEVVVVIWAGDEMVLWVSRTIFYQKQPLGEAWDFSRKVVLPVPTVA